MMHFPGIFVLAGLVGVAPSELESRVIGIAGELARLGYNVDTSKLAVETLTSAKCHGDLDRQQDLYFPRDHFEEMRFFNRALGFAHTETASDLREFVVGSMASTLAAYYQPDRKAIVFLQTATDSLLAHELTHAAQDRKRGLAALLGGAECTLERVRTAQCVVEGEAELAAAALMQARAGKTLDDLREDALDDPLQRLVAGTASLPYTNGRRFVLRRFHEGGWQAVANCLDRLPPSTEQILHPEKLGQDNPVSVALPRARDVAAGVELRHEDGIGELAIETLLNDLGVSTTEARRAATGWDGDRVGVYHAANGDVAVAWRCVWDRDEDAMQFAAAIDGRFRGSIARTGRVVDATWATAPRLAEQVAAALRSHPSSIAPDPRDAKTTAAIEAADLARETDVQGKRWVVREHGLTIPIPSGWSEREMRGSKFLVGASAAGFQDNFSVVDIPDPTGGDLDAIVRDSRKVFASATGLSLDAITKRSVANANAVWLEYHGRFQPEAPSSHFLAVIVPRDGKQLVITATVAAERWPTLKPLLERSLEAVRLDPSSSR